MYNACCANHYNLRQRYEGEEGALKFAESFGYGIPDSPRSEWRDVIQSSYSYLCVRFYNLNPPISAKEWINTISKAIKQRVPDFDIKNL
jgi:hypothetical protein